MFIVGVLVIVGVFGVGIVLELLGMRKDKEMRELYNGKKISLKQLLDYKDNSK